jgi:2'-5' RNA ligase
MRLFIAIPLSLHLETALIRTQEALRTRGVQGNFTPEDNLHLTLAFIGEYPDPEPVLDVLASVSVHPFPLTLDGLGAFHQVWWAGIRENPELDAYVKRLRHALAEAGIPYDRKRFSPHITLVRKPTGRGEEALGGLHFAGESMTVERISLFRSDRGKRGMVYTEVGAVQAPTPLLS